MNAATNPPVDQGDVEDSSATCVDQAITPIFPVRYAFADFELLESSLAYPSAKNLLAAQTSSQAGGLSLRMLRQGWVMIFDEDKKIWHPFEYSLDLGANVEKFTKYCWLEGNAAGPWVIERRRTSSDSAQAINGTGQQKIYPYAFVPRSTTNFSICFTPVCWSAKTFEILQSNDDIRKSVMQRANAHKEQYGNFEMAPDLAKPLIEDFQEQGHLIPPDSWDLSGTTLVPKESRGNVVSMMANCAERGVVVALHDPLGIAMDIGALCARFNIDKALYTEKHKYALTTLTQVESVVDKAVTPLSYDAEGRLQDSVSLPLERSGRAFDLYECLNQEKFNEYRNKFARDFAIFDGRIEKAIALWQDWMGQTGAGSVQVAMQQINSTHADLQDMQLVFTAVEQMSFGLSSSKAGQKALYNELIKKDANNVNYLKVASDITGKAMSWAALHDRCSEMADNMENVSGVQLSTAVKSAINGTMEVLGSLMATQVMQQGQDRWRTMAGNIASYIHQKPLGTKVMNLAEALTELGKNGATGAAQGARQAMISGVGMLESLRFNTIQVEVLTIDGQPVISSSANELASKVGAGLGLWGAMASSFQLSQASRNAVEKIPGSATAKWMHSIPAQVLYIGVTLADGLLNISGQNTRFDQLLQRGGQRAVSAISRLYPAGLSTLAQGSVMGQNVLSVGTKLASAGKTLLMKVLKLGTIMGVIEIVVGAIAAWEKFERGDLDAALGGAMIVSAGLIWTIAGASSLLPGFGWVAAGFILLAGGILVMAFGEDDALTAWVKNGFWGSENKWSGARYLYFGNQVRRSYDFEGKLGFDAFMARSKELSNDEEVQEYFNHEVSAFHNIIYKSKVTLKGVRRNINHHHSLHLTITLSLPGFISGQSTLSGHLQGNMMYLADLEYTSTEAPWADIEFDIREGVIMTSNNYSEGDMLTSIPDSSLSRLRTVENNGHLKKYLHTVPLDWNVLNNGDFEANLIYRPKYFSGDHRYRIMSMNDFKFTYTYYPTIEVAVPILLVDGEYQYGETIKF